MFLGSGGFVGGTLGDPNMSARPHGAGVLIVGVKGGRVKADKLRWGGDKWEILVCAKVPLHDWFMDPSRLFIYFFTTRVDIYVVHFIEMVNMFLLGNHVLHEKFLVSIFFLCIVILVFMFAFIFKGHVAKMFLFLSGDVT